ncbi:MAG TPA: MFS transporter [Bacillota bacterium]|jgi:MFS family permease
MSSDQAVETGPRVGSPFAVFKHYNYRLYWSGQLVSHVGTWMQTAAQAWLVLQLTESPFLLSLVTAAQTLPMLLLSLPAGAVADRQAKRHILVVTQTTMAVQALLLAFLVWSGYVRYWHILILATILGVARTYDVPTRQAFVIEMVGREDLMSALAMNATIVNGARIFGPALAGLVMAGWGAGWAFFVNGVSFLAIIYALVAMRLPPHQAEAKTRRSVWKDSIDGLAYVTSETRVLLTLLLLGFIGTFVQNYDLLVPVLARNALGQTAAGYGFMMSAMGVGAVTASFALASSGRRKPGLRDLLVTAGLLSALMASVSLVGHYWLALVGMLLIGVLNMSCMVWTNTSVQLAVPDHLRGRVMAIYSLLHTGVTPVGSVFLGAMMSHFGPRAGWVSAGGMGLLSVALVTTLAALAGLLRRKADVEARA